MLLVLLSLLVVTYFCVISQGNLRIIDVLPVPRNKHHTFDCLIKPYEYSFSILSSHWMKTDLRFDEILQYCRRPTSFLGNQIYMRGNHSVYSFDDLRLDGISYEQLYQWNAPIDLIEEYIAGSTIGQFVNCSGTLWFGSKCEYTFDIDGPLSSITMHQSLAKNSIPIDLSLFTNGTCYEMNDTDCQSILCLDWREICDGKIDCSNGYDERHCLELEWNECNSGTEYRCSDGQCVDNSPNSDELAMTCSEPSRSGYSPFSYCSREYGILCEIQRCFPLYFSCGDGYCYDGPSAGKRSCPTQRDRRYLQQMPTTSSMIFFSHIMVNYTNTQPEFICYNRSLCPYLSAKYNLNSNCFRFKMLSNRSYDHVDEMVIGLKRLLRSCSLLPLEYDDPNAHCSMFRCNDGSKCLSFHRLSNGVEDCVNGEDEHQLDVCSRNLSARFICDNGTKCLSQSLFLDRTIHCNDSSDEHILTNVLIHCKHLFSEDCHLNLLLYETQMVRFYQICNGVIEYASDVDQNTDESHCLPSEWPCETFYSKCDRLWNCPDGRDELGCSLLTRSSLYCNNTAHFCLHASTGEPLCLSPLQVADGMIDCVGSWDEREFCRMKYPFEITRRYRCRNSSICIGGNLICNCQQNCPENDDETIACRWAHHEQQCNSSVAWIERCRLITNLDHDGRKDLFCDLEDKRNTYFWDSHLKAKPLSISKQSRVQRQVQKNVNYSVIWSCNRGLYVRSNKDPEGFACFCPDHYYGDRCQYQRKRVFINLQMRMLSAFHQRISTSVFVVLLVQNNLSKMTLIYHVQFVMMPQYQCEQNFAVQLLYPVEEPNRSLRNHSVHIHMFDRETLRHQKSWKFPLNFEFLPVQRLSKRLEIPESDIDGDSEKLPLAYSSCTSCSNRSLCIGHDVTLAQDICVCSTNYTGRRCLLPLNFCRDIDCNGRGKCQPTSIYEITKYFQTVCTCEPGWAGAQCEKTMRYVSVSLTSDMAHLSSSIAFLHLIQNPFYDSKSHDIYAHHFKRETLNLTFFNIRTIARSHAAFIQFYEHASKFDYYLLFYYPYHQEPWGNIAVQVQSSHQCRSVRELFNATILSLADIHRVKYYQQPCLHHRAKSFLCFYDDDLMCVCRSDNYTDCLRMQTRLTMCHKKWCNERGICVQDDRKCLTYSRCICDECFYGRICQFSTQGYSLSLDGILGSHISLSVATFSQQSSVVHSAVAIISIFVVSGIVLNLLSIMTFVQKETHEVGSGLYLLISSIMGLFTVLILLGKMIVLLLGERSHASCFLAEFLLRWCPISCEWLNACVAFERIIAVKCATKYSRSKSKLLSKYITLAILILVAGLCTPELIFHRIIIDPFDNRAWCVLTVNKEQTGLLAMYTSINALSFLIPLAINVISGVIIVLTTFQLKEKIKKEKKNEPRRTRFELIRIEILKHKHIFIGPVLLGVLSLPRLVLIFIFVCTKLDEKSIPSLFAYLVAFLPSMAIIFAFICPAQTYRTALIKSLRTICFRWIRNSASI